MPTIITRGSVSAKGFGFVGISKKLITTVNIGSKGNSTGATTAITGVNVPAGSLIIVGVYEDNSTANGSISDGVNSGSYTAVDAGLNTGGGWSSVYYLQNSVALSAATITYTKNTSGNTAIINAFYATNIVSTSSLDTSVTASNSGTSTTPSVTSGTATVAGELFVAALITKVATAYTQDTAHGWAIPFNTAQFGPGAVYGGNQVNTGTSAITFTPSVANSTDWATWILGFKPA